MKSKSEILEQQENAQGNKITEYIGKDGYVWQMILNAMEEYAQQQVNGASTSKDQALNLAFVSNSEAAVLELECFLCDATFDNQKDLDEHYKTKHQN